VGVRILTTHTGSLVRPDDLVAFLRAREDGEPYDEAAFERALERAVRGVVARQVDAGLDAVDDGEFPKPGSWSKYVQERLGGFEHRTTSAAGEREIQVLGADRRAFPEFYAEYDGSQGHSTRGDWVCVGPIAYRGQEIVHRDIDRLQRAIAAAGGTASGFVPAVGPTSALGSRGARALNEHYGSERDFLLAFADAMREEYRAITDAGLNLQIDDPILANRFDHMGAPSDKREYRRWFAEQVEIVNYALEGLPTEQTRYHMCWGSWHGPHVSDVPLQDIIDLLLQIDVGAFVIEGANPRHEHEWRVWAEAGLPADRKLVAGVVAHTTTTVEHPQLVAERLLRLAEGLAPGQLVAGTDCGFAQGPFVRRLHPSVVWAKLGSLVAGARLASETLTRRDRAGARAHAGSPH
jgi:5-methyltetrahydropteroyltriglutamate--homocysteine methyltransferase